MQFTPREIKWIERLQKHERRWRYARWLVLVIGVLSLLACAGWGWILYKVMHEGGPERLDSMDVFIIVMLWTKCCFWFVIGVLNFNTACTKWHGDPNRALLLKLLDEHQLKTTQTSPPSDKAPQVEPQI